jgi:hypothetical protein
VLIWIGATVLFLVFLAWGPSGGARRLLGTLILAGLLALGLEVWRRQTLTEFPETDEAPELPPSASKTSVPQVR